jgi:hypothetical protein
MRFIEIYSGPLNALPLCEAHGSAPTIEGDYVSKANPLRGARGGLMALGLEAFAALLAYYVYSMLRP